MLRCGEGMVSFLLERSLGGQNGQFNIFTFEAAFWTQVPGATGLALVNMLNCERFFIARVNVFGVV